MEKLKEYFQDKKIAEILDVGTGSGDFIEVLKQVFPSGEITGIDPNADSLKTASEKYPDVKFVVMTGENLEFENDSFNLASISMALHHLPDVAKTLAEMQRVVKPSGWIIVSELFSDNLNPAQQTHKMFHHFRSSVDRLLGVSHRETFKKQEIIDMVDDSGINIQFYFEFLKDENLIKTGQDIEERVIRLQMMLEEVSGFPEAKTLEPQIEKFRKNAEKFGFQPATRVVIVGQVNQ